MSWMQLIRMALCAATCLHPAAAGCEGDDCSGVQTPSSSPSSSSSSSVSPSFSSSVVVTSQQPSQDFLGQFTQVSSPNIGDRKHRDASAVLPFIGLTGNVCSDSRCLSADVKQGTGMCCQMETLVNLRRRYRRGEAQPEMLSRVVAAVRTEEPASWAASAPAHRSSRGGAASTTSASGAVVPFLTANGFRKDAPTAAVVTAFCTASPTSSTKTVMIRRRYIGIVLQLSGQFCLAASCIWCCFFPCFSSSDV